MAFYTPVFFDTSSQDDLDLLHSSIRDDSELSNVVSKVEWEILNAFKQRDMEGLGTYEAFFEYESGRDPNDEIKVRLVGYDSSAPANSDAGLKEVLKITIAEITSWVLRNYNNSDGIKSIQQGKRSVTYIGHAPSWKNFPSGWDSELQNYDARIKSYGI